MNTAIQRRMSIVLIIALIATLIPMVTNLTAKPATAATPINQTMSQYFEWYTPGDLNHWNRVAERAADLKALGLSALWLPPAVKGDSRNLDVGYGTYDHYDLGEYDTFTNIDAPTGRTGVYVGGAAASAKAKISTKYGSRSELDAAISALHANGIAAYADVVINHKAVESFEQATVKPCELWGNRYNCGPEKTIGAYTISNFGARIGKVAKPADAPASWDWKINKGWFNGVDWDANSKTSAAYLLQGRTWNTPIDSEFANFDYLMYGNNDFSQQFVLDYHRDWMNWMLSSVKFDGFRIDAVKHIKFDVFTNKAGTGMLDQVRKTQNKNVFAVGEYWNRDLGSLLNYLNNVDWKFSLFDVPLHYKFFDIGKGGFDMRNLNSGNLGNYNYGMNAVTFVENHDTQYGQALLSPVADWAKPMGYAYILNRQEGLPMIFYADLYGYEYRPAGYSNGTLGSKEGVKGNLYSTIQKLMIARTAASYGKQNDYFDDADMVGFTREGVSDIANSGSATVLCDGWVCNGTNGKFMFMGLHNANKTFKNLLGTKVVTVGGSGWGFFPAEGNASVYVNSLVNSIIPSVGYVAPADPATAAVVVTPAPTATPVPTAAPTPVPVMAAATPTPAPLAAITNQTVQLYFKKSGFTNANIHYRNTKDAVWTVAPGVKMASDSTTGYFKVSVTIPDGSQLEACFNNGSTWDSNGGKNYLFNGNSIVTVTDGKITAGAPASLAIPVANTPAPTAAPTLAPAAVATPVPATPVPTPVPTAVPQPTSTPAPASVTSVSVSFSLTGVSTVFGENVNVAGDFNGWNTTSAKLACSWSSTTGCTWTGKITVPANKITNFKFVKVTGSGAATWESAYSGNRTVTAGTTNPDLITAKWNVK